MRKTNAEGWKVIMILMRMMIVDTRELNGKGSVKMVEDKNETEGDILIA